MRLKLRVKICTLLVTVRFTGTLLDRAAGETPPPERRGSVPSRVKMTELPGLGPGVKMTVNPAATRPPVLLRSGGATKLVSMKSSRFEYQKIIQSTSFW